MTALLHLLLALGLVRLLAAQAILLTPATVVSMFVGVLVPALVALVAREHLPVRAKAILTLVLTTTSAVVASVVSWPTNSSGWWHLAYTWLMTVISAVGSLVASWVPQSPPANVVAAIHRATDPHFGLGPLPVEPVKDDGPG